MPLPHPKAPQLPKHLAGVLDKHVEPFISDVRKAILAEAKHTAALALEDGADTKHGQSRLYRTLGRETTPAEQKALEDCIHVILAALEPS